MEQPRMQIPGYEIIRQIGEGGSRTAYLALREHCTDPTVVKVFRTNGVHERIADQRERHSLQEILQAEVEILRRFSHPNIIRIFNHGNVDDSFFIEEEYMAGGTVEDALPELNEHKALDVFQQMTRGVRFLHNKGILVRDLKLNNALFSQDREEVKIDDLELCGKVQGQYLRSRGSDRYTAPELFAGVATEQTDIYALGACLYYMLTKERDTFAHLNRLQKREYENGLEAALERVPRVYYDLVRGCLAFTPEERFFTALDVLEASENIAPLEKYLLGKRDWNVLPEQEYFERVIGGKRVVFRDAVNGEVAGLLSVYPRVFNHHNIFTGSSEGVLEYLFTSNRNMRLSGGGYIVAVDDEVIGGLLVRPQDYDRKGMHLRVSYNHVAVVDSALETDVMGALLEAADRKVLNFMRQNGIRSTKIHVGLAPDEIRTLPVYLAAGMAQEGIVKDKYRFGEEVIELGKTITL